MRTVPLLLVALAVTAGCSSSPSTSTPRHDAGAALPPGVTTATFSMESVVKPGQESFVCQFMTAPATGDKFIVEASHVYTPGSHHMLFFRTDLTAIPAGGAEPQDCYEGPSGNVMSHVRGVVYGAQTPLASQTYPAGVGLPLASGEIVLMQTHYLNAGATDLDTRVDLTLQLSDGTGITTRAGVLLFFDPFIDVPPQSTTARAQMRCTLPSAITLLSASSHTHARGTGFGAYLDGADGTLAPTPFYTSTDWTHPIPLETNMPIAAGAKIRFSCDYTNTDPTLEYFQGQSATTNEMCVFYGVYYPEMGQDADFCEVDGAADMFGTGKTSCSPSLTCLQACASAGIAFPTPSISDQDVDPCYQKCLVNGCPTTSAKVFDLQSCTDSSCATECADPGSTQCQSCAFTNCQAQVSACLSDSCN